MHSDKGSEWRRWDLHIHTKGTNKNDQYHESADFEAFCVTLFQQAVEKKIAAIGITDYFSIDNYKKVVDFVKSIDLRSDFNDEEKDAIKSILILPNVELRMTPVTDSGRLVNIHCIFNPEIVDNLESDFFSSMKHSTGAQNLKMTRTDITRLGRTFDKSLDDDAAYKKGIDTFTIEQSQLQELLTNSELAENVLIVVSNSTTDGASGLQKHYDLFEGTDPGSLDSVRRSIYRISHAIFSGNDGDRQYFLGQKADSEEVVRDKCGSLKPCIHGSDAHTESKLFMPDNDRFCWIKADVTFEGLKQIIYEPADRVFIGLEPSVIGRVRTNKTKYIDSLTIKHKAGYDKAQGVWFDDVHIPFSKELITIIGNKGSGKSALSDIIGVLGNTHNAGSKHENLSFLKGGKTLKFRKKGYAENFEAELAWEDGTGKDKFVPLDRDVDPDEFELVKYLPQNYFENLTNDLEGEGFNQTLKSVIFLHLPEEQRLGKRTFDELEEFKSKSIDADLLLLREEVSKISEDIIKLEVKRHPDHIKRLQSSIKEKKKELVEHDKIKPDPAPDPSKEDDEGVKAAKTAQYTALEKLNADQEAVSLQIREKRSELNELSKSREELTQLDNSLARLETQIESYVTENAEAFQRYGIDIKDVVKATFNKKLLKEKRDDTDAKILVAEATVRTKTSIEQDAELSDNPAELKKAQQASLLIKLDSLSEQIAQKKKDLSRPEKLFQEYKEKLNKWQKSRDEIEGSDTRLNSLKFFEKELEYIQKELGPNLALLRNQRLQKTLDIFRKQKEIIELYKMFKQSIDKEISKDEEFAKKFKMLIDVNFKLDVNFAAEFLRFINKTRGGTFYGTGEKEVTDLLSEKDFLSEEDISLLLNTVIEWLEQDQKRSEDDPLRLRQIADQVSKVQDFYDFLFSLKYLKPIYELKLDGKVLDELSPGEKGTLLLVFYLMIDKEEIPLIIDQPEDNLDNKSVFQVLTHFIKTAKKRRQIIIVTHNPNLAVGADAEQVIYVELDKKDNHNVFSFEVGAIENPDINKRLVEILEGTMPAFDKRKLRYRKEL